MEHVSLGTYSLINGGMGEDTPKTLEEKFKWIKELGYDGVELLLSELEENTPEELEKALAKYGLACVSAHVWLESMEKMIPVMARLGAKQIICPNARMATKIDAVRVAAELNRLGAIGVQYGIQVGYHNHDGEFTVDGGKSVEEHLIENTDPATVTIQLDCGWAAAAGIWAPNFIRRYPGRFRSVHVKENTKVFGTAPMPPFPIPADIDEAGRQRYKDHSTRSVRIMATQCALGAPESNLDWQEIKKALEAQNIGEIVWIVERENTYAGTRTDCLREDCAWLKKNL